MPTIQSTQRPPISPGSSVPVRRSAALLLVATGLLHLVIVGEYFDAAAYLGVLFVAGAGLAFFAAHVLWREDDRRAWGLGVVITAGMFVGYLLSRTVGLPTFHEEEWEVSGTISLLLEGGFLLAAAAAVLPARRRRPPS